MNGVRNDIAQSLTAPQQTQARTNIGAQANLGYTPVNKAGDTITGGLTVNGELVAATNYIRFVTSGGPGYLQYLGGSTYTFGGYTAWHTGNINPVSKAGDTMTGQLTTVPNSQYISVSQQGTGSLVVQSNLSHASMSFVAYGYFGANFGVASDGNFYMGGWSHGANVYKFWTGRDFGSCIINGRLAFAADYSVNANGMTEPYGGAVMTGFGWSGGATNGRFRYMQLQNNAGTWFTIGYA